MRKEARSRTGGKATWCESFWLSGGGEEGLRGMEGGREGQVNKRYTH